jgi:hypothetical protein
MRCRVEYERDFGGFTADEGSVGFVIPIELEWTFFDALNYRFFH